MKKKKSNILVTVLLLLFLALFLILIVREFYGMINSKNKDNYDGKRTEVQKLLDKDFDKSYPATQREVVKVYCRIMKEMYSGDCSDENVQGLFSQMRKLYDEELLEKNTFDSQYEKLQDELKEYKKNKKKIVNYTVEEPENVENGVYKDREQSLVDVVISMKEGKEWQHVGQQFVLRKDDDGRWKILGWYKTETELGEKNE